MGGGDGRRARMATFTICKSANKTMAKTLVIQLHSLHSSNIHFLPKSLYSDGKPQRWHGSFQSARRRLDVGYVALPGTPPRENHFMLDYTRRGHTI